MAQSECPHCHGSGMTLTWVLRIPTIIECGYCNGTGKAGGD
jgi:DnaJ-class molecular chaperone